MRSVSIISPPPEGAFPAVPEPVPDGLPRYCTPPCPCTCPSSSPCRRATSPVLPVVGQIPRPMRGDDKPFRASHQGFKLQVGLSAPGTRSCRKSAFRKLGATTGDSAPLMMQHESWKNDAAPAKGARQTTSAFRPCERRCHAPAATSRTGSQPGYPFLYFHRISAAQASFHHATPATLSAGLSKSRC